MFIHQNHLDRETDVYMIGERQIKMEQDGYASGDYQIQQQVFDVNLSISAIAKRKVISFKWQMFVCVFVGLMQFVYKGKQNLKKE